MAEKKTKKVKSSRRKRKPSASQVAKAEEQFTTKTLDKRHKLMWLGVSISCLIIIILWVFSWQIDFPSLSKENGQAGQTSKFEEVTNELAETISGMKNSMAIIDQAVEEAEARDEKEQITEDLKEEVLNKLEEKKGNQEEEEPPIIIFE